MDMHLSMRCQSTRRVEIVLEAVKQKGKTLNRATATHKAGREFTREAVKQNACAPRYAAPGHKAGREIVFEVVKKNLNSHQ